MTAQLRDAYTADEAIAVLEADGVVRLPDLLTAEQLATVKADLTPLMTATPDGSDPYFAGTKTRRLGRLFKHTRGLDAAALSPVIHGAAAHFLGTPKGMWYGQDRVDEKPTYQIGATQCIQIHPGQGLQPLHRDDSIFYTVHPGRTDGIGVMTAVSDFTEANGATRVIPGSHLWDDERMPLVSETIPAEMTAGSAVMWLAGTYHGGGQNVTDDSVRTGAILGFFRGYLRQEENHYLSLSLDEIRQMPREIQDLLGFTASNPYMGWIEYNGEMADPRVVLGDVENAGLHAGVAV
ncbi:phytanoyl-CoA dioxygenase family protein [Gordonia sp. TBRC 11910]|uniref:Phytanoyl-CoA dioxygenase family protein n=1 Tax=Gordonia asplenii TaxID=2725283 RepID=A0A848L3L5_9ACTN|nr:phytanoyl-CoA dioxygenase family protein [Gordonia asplenii]NMO03171.1 phytanoyl-CoA dioxygenase family protein [Gordonia asplenii]